MTFLMSPAKVLAARRIPGKSSFETRMETARPDETRGKESPADSKATMLFWPRETTRDGVRKRRGRSASRHR